jgi:GTP-binding protein Era
MEITQHLGRPVHLFLHVKVNPRWDEDRGLYRDIGLEWAD